MNYYNKTRKSFMDGRLTMNYYKPERPFLLIASDNNGEISYSWSETESDLKAIAKEHIEYGCEIICAMEVNSCRYIDI